MNGEINKRKTACRWKGYEWQNISSVRSLGLAPKLKKFSERESFALFTSMVHRPAVTMCPVAVGEQQTDLHSTCPFMGVGQRNKGGIIFRYDF